MPHATRILQCLPPEELAALQPHLANVRLVSTQTLYERGGSIEHVYFIENGMASLVSGHETGKQGVDVGVAGREGILEVAAMFDGEARAFYCTLVQMPGSALRIPALELQRMAADLPILRSLGIRYMQAMTIQAAQNSACNTLHNLEQRVAKWLLIAADCSNGNELPLTQEVLSKILGVRRPAISLAAARLKDAGLIAYTRGHVALVDHSGLETAACTCYRVVRNEFDRLLGRHGQLTEG